MVAGRAQVPAVRRAPDIREIPIRPILFIAAPSFENKLRTLCGKDAAKHGNQQREQGMPSSRRKLRVDGTQSGSNGGRIRAGKLCTMWFQFSRRTRAHLKLKLRVPAREY